MTTAEEDLNAMEGLLASGLVSDDLKSRIRGEIETAGMGLLETLLTDGYFKRSLFAKLKQLKLLDEAENANVITVTAEVVPVLTELAKCRTAYRGPKGEIIHICKAAGLASATLSTTTYGRVEKGIDLNPRDVKLKRQETFLRQLQLRLADEDLMIQVHEYCLEVRILRLRGDKRDADTVKDEAVTKKIQQMCRERDDECARVGEGIALQNRESFRVTKPSTFQILKGEA